MASGLRRSIAIYLKEENIWYGTNRNLKIAQAFDKAGVGDLQTFRNDTSEKALLVFGKHVSLDPKYNAHWVKSLSERYDVMVICVETYAELNIWFQNILAKTIHLSSIVFNVHGNPTQFTFNPDIAGSEVVFTRDSFIPQFKETLKLGADVSICGCQAGQERFLLQPGYGIMKRASGSRELSFKLPGITVRAPNRTISSREIIFQDGHVAFRDGVEDTTESFLTLNHLVTNCSAMEELLPFPKKLAEVFEKNSTTLEIAILKKLFFLSMDNLFISSGIEILKQMTPKIRKGCMTDLFDSLPTQIFWGWIKESPSAWGNQWLEFLEGIENEIKDPFLLLPKKKKWGLEYVGPMFQHALKGKKAPLLESILIYASENRITLSREDCLAGIKEVILWTNANSLKRVLEYTSKMPSLISVFKEGFTLISSKDREIFQSRELAELFRRFSSRKDYTAAKEMFTYCAKFRIYVKPARLKAWLTEVKALEDAEAEAVVLRLQAS